MNDLLEQRDREWDVADYVCRLAGIVGQELGEVFERPELGFGGFFEDGEFLRRGVDVAETAAG